MFIQHYIDKYKNKGISKYAPVMTFEIFAERIILIKDYKETMQKALQKIQKEFEIKNTEMINLIDHNFQD